MSDIQVMNDEGLLACPFCGNDAYFENDGSDHFVACEKCGCGTDDWLSKESAVKAWNTRKGHLWTVDDFKQMNAERNI